MRGRLCCVLSVIFMLLGGCPVVAGTTVDLGNRFTLLGQFSEGLCRISDGILTGYVDLTGNIVIEPRYVDAYDFCDGKAWVSVGEKYGKINMLGELEEGYIYDRPAFPAEPVDEDNEALVSFKNKNSILWGFRDDTGTERIRPQYYAVREFSEGLAAVSFNNKWGYLDTGGEIVIPMHYNSAESFSQGLAIVNRIYAVDKNNIRILRSYNVDGRKGVIYYSAEDRPEEHYLDETDNSIIYGLLKKDLQKEYGKKLTRAEFCILIMHMMASVEGIGENPVFYFDDTADIDINHAFLLHIVDGIGDRLYAPDREITRQEVAKILYNYAGYLGLETKSGKQTLSDRKQFADWAEVGIDYAVSRGLMQPEKGAFFPVGTCTKQESIAYIYRLYRLFLTENGINISKGFYPD